jgi:hypothetical protein
MKKKLKVPPRNAVPIYRAAVSLQGVYLGFEKTQGKQAGQILLPLRPRSGNCDRRHTPISTGLDVQKHIKIEF